MLRVTCVLLTVLSLGQAQYFGEYQCNPGRDVIVHLFEWKWSSIESHCPQLAEWGYCAVQVSPPQEHVVLPSNDPPHPWWQRYQPVSYKLDSRSGSEAEFDRMVSNCNTVGVKIYVDGIINHMTGGGSGTGSAGSGWDGGNDESGQWYPGVPFGEGDFNQRDVCFTSNMEIQNYGNADEVRNCRLVALRDLDTDEQWVRDQLSGYMRNLVNKGVAGFRLDASKHMYPYDIHEILKLIGNIPFIFQEVIDQGGEPITAGEYTYIGRVTEFLYSTNLGDVIYKSNGQYLSYLKNFGEGWGFMNGLDAVVFVSNHDNQRGHGGGSNPVTFKTPKEYKMANAFMLGWDYGYPRVMSSYEFSNNDAGPPSDGGGNTFDTSCFDGNWVCEHAWRQIYNMVKFHNVVVGEPVANWWDNGPADNHAIAWGRGSKGFVILNNEDFGIQKTLQTGMPAGQYCDVMGCESNRPPCTGSECGPEITVNSDGTAYFDVTNDANPYRAIHV